MPYLKYQERQLLFREAVIGFLVGETKDEKQKRIENEYCNACRIVKKDVDCRRCDKRVEVIEDGGK